MYAIRSYYESDDIVKCFRLESHQQIFHAGTFMLRKEAGSAFHKLFQLMIWCSVSAMITGALFGSYFGYKWVQPIWFDYHGIIAGHAGPGFITDIGGILLITIYFGIAVIGLGLVLNWIRNNFV